MLVACNIIPDVSDHFSQFYFIISEMEKKQQKSLQNAIFYVYQWIPLAKKSHDVDLLFSSFYKSIYKIINKQAPIKTVSKRKKKLLSK